MRFLVVDDEVSICRRTAHRLKQIPSLATAAVDCAYSGEEALQLLQATGYDVLITDIRMNGMDGLALIEEAKQLHPSLAAILVSAFDQFEYAKRGIRLGVHDFWVKPYTLQQMEASLNELLCQLNKEWQQKNRQLDVALREAIAVSGMPLAEVFRQQRQAENVRHLLLVVGRQPMNHPDPQGALWVYQPVNRAYLALGYNQELELHQYLQGLVENSGQSVGVSLPDGDTAELFAQASAALKYDWIYPQPTIFYYTPIAPGDQSVQTTCKRLLKQAVVAPPESVLAEISRIEGVMSQPYFLSLMDELYKNLLLQLGEWQVDGQGAVVQGADRPPPYTDWKNALARLLNELLYTKKYHLDRSKNDPVQWAKTYVGEHLHEQVDMAVVANELNLSYPYFSKLFSDQVGMPFSQYLLELRMKEACRLLLMGERVTAISRLVGYQNVNNFIRAFKKLYGVSPTAFRHSD